MKDHVGLIEPEENSIVNGVRAFFKGLLEKKMVDAVFVPMGQGEQGSVMPALVTDPGRLDRAEPFSPCFPLNSGRMASRISWRNSGRKTAVLLRPCEHRAFVELVKLKQGSRDELVLIGTDCPGALSWKDVDGYLSGGAWDPDAFVKQVFGGSASPFEADLNGFGFSTACQTCGHCFPENADIHLVLHGADLGAGVLAEAATETGQSLLEAMQIPKASLPDNRDEIKEQIQAAAASANEAMVAGIEEKTNTLAKLETFLDRCINCYNCRNMCPVCYCRECVFNTDVFVHQPVQYFQWSENKGCVKLPTDTLFYHLTRMAHMSHACVGCGQCSNACPSEIPVFELFKSVAALTQAAFEYRPGMDEDQAPPLAVFREKELEEVVGI